MKKNKKISRREFVQTTSSAVISTSVLGGMLSACGKPGSEKSRGSNQGANNENDEDSRFLVCLVLGGGNDSFNMLVPNSQAAYNEYALSRSNLALSKTSLLSLNGFKDKNQKTFGLHPSMEKLQHLFNSNKASFIANTGVLTEKVTKASFENNSVKIPLGLMSHADQFKHLQTATPDFRSSYGWFGKMSDILSRENSNKNISMNISLSGNNLLQVGKNSFEYSITNKGSVGIEINDQGTDLDRTLFSAFNNILNQSHNDPFKSTYLNTARVAQRNHKEFSRALGSVGEFNTRFSESELSQNFKIVAKSIAASKSLGMKRQTFFIHYYGWDHHNELLNSHGKMLKILSDALGEFHLALEEKGLDKNTVTFSLSDFGRTLSSNGNGTDHGWGGNNIIMGGGLKGGQIFGEYPKLVLGSSLDIGGGVLIPTLAQDLVFAEIAMWFGIKKDKLPSLFPNLKNFYNIRDPLPIGIFNS